MKTNNFFCLLAILVILLACISLALGSEVFGAVEVIPPSPTRRPIKTPTPSKSYLPIIRNGEPEYRPTHAPTEPPGAK